MIGGPVKIEIRKYLRMSDSPILNFGKEILATFLCFLRWRVLILLGSSMPVECLTSLQSCLDGPLWDYEPLTLNMPNRPIGFYNKMSSSLQVINCRHNCVILGLTPTFS